MAEVQQAIESFSTAVRGVLVSAVGRLSEAGQIPKKAGSALIREGAGFMQTVESAGWERIRGAYMNNLMDMYEELLAKLEGLIDEKVRAQLLQLIKGNLADLDYLAVYMAGQVRDRLAGLAGGTYDDAIGTVEGIANEFRARLITVIQTGMGMFHNYLVIAQSQSAGIERFAMLGPNDPTTRPHCRHFVGTSFTQEEYMAYADEWERDGEWPFEMLGGYNCRHYLIAITPDLAGKYPEGPR